MWTPTLQARRQAPDASLTELFVLLHGMLFTNIQLDDFKPVLDRFMERLRLEGAEEREWIMMAVTDGDQHCHTDLIMTSAPALSSLLEVLPIFFSPPTSSRRPWYCPGRCLLIFCLYLHVHYLLLSFFSFC